MYKIAGIYHNGKEGNRWDLRKDDKHDGLRGCFVKFNPNDVKLMNNAIFKFCMHQLYQEWYSDEKVIGFWHKRGELNGNDLFFLETVNTIYILEELR